MLRIVQLPPAAVDALAEGDLAAAETYSPVPLSAELAGPAHRALWRRRSRQLAEHPADEPWVTGVIWDGERAVGRAGFHGAPDAEGMVEVGYAVDPAYRRRGYARAALEALLDRAAREPAVRTVRASVSPDNVASRALLAQYGFVEVGEQEDDEDGPETVLEVPAVQRWRSTVRVRLRHPSRPLVLAGPPPEVELAGRVELPEFLAAFRERHGLELTVLAVLRDTFDQAELRRDVLLLAVPRGPEPAGAVWTGPPAEPVPPKTGAAGERVGVEPPQPWGRVDWFPATEAWLAAAVPLTGPVEQHKVWDLSCVLRAPTAAGDVWLKSTVAAPLLADEPRVTIALARLFPDRVPRPVAADPERGLLVLADFGPVLGWRAPVAARARALRAWGRLQRDSEPHAAELRAAGCRDRGLDWLADAVAEWFRPAVRDRFGGPDLAAAVPRLRALCAELAGYGIADTLQHGDLHCGNVAGGAGGADGAGGYVFFDWTDAAVGHPFLDAIAVGQDPDPAGQDRLRRAYLAAWPAAAAAAWPVAEVLSAANQAVSYLSLGTFLGPSSTVFASYTVHWLDLVADRVAAAERGMAAWPA